MYNQVMQSLYSQILCLNWQDWQDGGAVVARDGHVHFVILVVAHVVHFRLVVFGLVHGLYGLQLVRSGHSYLKVTAGSEHTWNEFTVGVVHIMQGGVTGLHRVVWELYWEEKTKNTFFFMHMYILIIYNIVKFDIKLWMSKSYH